MTESGGSTTDTATALLDAAEAAFAEHGIDGGSLRAIMREAGANPAAIHYHFGTRDALVEAVLDRTLGPINRRRRELLEELTAVRSTPSLEELLEVLIRPDLEAATALNTRTPGAARLLASIYVRPSTFVTELVEARFAPVADAFLPYMSAALPGIPADLVAWRVRWFVFGTLGAVMADGAVEVTEASLDELLRRLVTSAVGAVAAPTG